MNKSLKIFSAYLTAFLIVAYLSYALPKMLPGDFVSSMYSSSNVTLTAEEESELKAFYTNDDGFSAFLLKVITLDPGFSYTFSSRIGDLIAESLPWTILLLGCANIISFAAGFFMGVEIAYRKGTAFERRTIGVLTVFEGFPEIATGVILLAVFALHLNWFPSSGSEIAYADHTFFERFFDILHHLFLPLLTLIIAYVPGNILLVRNTMVMVLGEKFILTARSKGLPEFRVRYRHAARNSLLPYVTKIGLRIAFMVTGALVVESIHSYPGLGTLLFNAIGSRDLPLIQAVVLYSSVIILLVNMALDFIYPLIDPRIRSHR